MENAFEDGHQLQGEPIDSVGQDTGETQESSGNWEDQAKYFQSEKDKLAAENQNLKKYEQLGQVLESRPDIVNAVTGMLQGGGQPQAPQQPQKITLDKDEYDPWEAYNDPQSKSYQFRQQELQDSINGAVNHQMAGIARQQGMQNLQGELSQHGLNPEEVKSFMEFASKNPAQYGVEGAIKMWRAVEAGQDPGNQPANPLDDIRQTQQTPASGGILQGQQPQAPKSDDDSMWAAITNAGSRTNVLK